MPILNPTQLVEEFKKSGEFDRLRRELLAQFRSSDGMESLMDRVQDIARQRLNADSKLQYMSEAAISRELMQELDRYPIIERAVADVRLLGDPSFAAGIRKSVTKILEEDRDNRNKPPADANSTTSNAPPQPKPRDPLPSTSVPPAPSVGIWEARDSEDAFVDEAMDISPHVPAMTLTDVSAGEDNKNTTDYLAAGAPLDLSPRSADVLDAKGSLNPEPPLSDGSVDVSPRRGFSGIPDGAALIAAVTPTPLACPESALQADAAADAVGSQSLTADDMSISPQSSFEPLRDVPDGVQSASGPPVQSINVLPEEPSERIAGAPAQSRDGATAALLDESMDISPIENPVPLPDAPADD
ncbi:hypothetical protein WOLCODRAFT_162863 [Wolfiporia cocos MD-104 SS10]|uniref:BOD1/SHG1 domain-containing protein n=1 Tax=Wolfiporia cocos (strain MD-104) TaxID=742152 RepID=A0A2H3JWS6_WOLCO|nr:hypothetical protein WOLCODRAFT_162863 [Wolfiporia cocos MD-104 SS10]